jgi:hypothetical protein
MPPGSGPGQASGPARRGGPPARPAAIDVAAAVLVFGGLFGFSQLAIGDYVLTGSLPAKGPIVGVASIAYAVSIVLGVVVRMGRGWLPAVNFAIIVALLYLPAAARLLVAALALGHGLAAVLLVMERGWFVEMSRWRTGTTVSRGRAGPRR